MKKLLVSQPLFLAFLIFAALSPSIVRADGTDLLKTSVPTDLNDTLLSSYMRNAGDFEAQQFITDASPRILFSATATLLNAAMFTPQDRMLMATIAVDNGGQPGTIVASALAPAAALSGSGYDYNISDVEFQFDHIVLSPSTTYWLVLTVLEDYLPDNVGIDLFWLNAFPDKGGSYDNALPWKVGLFTGTEVGYTPADETPGHSIAAFTLKGTKVPDPIVKGGPFTTYPNASYGSFYSPAINSQGTVAFRASLNILHSRAINTIVRIIGGGGQEMVAQSQAPSPDLGANFVSFGDPVLNNDGEIAFNALLFKDGTMITPANDTAVFADLGGTLHCAWQEGNPAPGTGGKQTFVKASWFNLAHGALFIGATTIDNSAVPKPVKSSGVWKWDGASLTPAVFIGETDITVNGVSHGAVTKISGPASSGNGNASARMVSTDGRLVLMLTFADKVTAIVEY